MAGVISPNPAVVRVVKLKYVRTCWTAGQSPVAKTVRPIERLGDGQGYNIAE